MRRFAKLSCAALSSELRELLEDFDDVTGIGARGKLPSRGWSQEILQKSELNHMESPEVDQRQEAKIDRQMESLFSRLPEPVDAMKAALRPSQGEIEAQERHEIFKEAVRERYRNRLAKQANESNRIAQAMKAVEDGTYVLKTEGLQEAVGGDVEYRPVRAASGEGAPVDHAEGTTQGGAAGAEAEAEALRREIVQMKGRLAALESKLKSQQH